MQLSTCPLNLIAPLAFAQPSEFTLDTLRNNKSGSGIVLNVDVAREEHQARPFHSPQNVIFFIQRMACNVAQSMPLAYCKEARRRFSLRDIGSKLHSDIYSYTIEALVLFNIK